METDQIKAAAIENGKRIYLNEYNKLADLLISNIEKNKIAKEKSLYVISSLLECYKTEDSKEFEGYQYTIETLNFLNTL